MNTTPSQAETADDVILRFDDVSRQFGTVTAVDGVSFALKRGEILTLLGPSGCGKTTTLRMAIGLERASAGCITYAGKVVDCPSERSFVVPEKRDMGMVFQSYAIWPHMTVFENVAYPLRYRKLSKPVIQEKVGSILEQVGLAGFEKRKGTQLSGGQQQRVAVARGLVSSPQLLLMDEPFSNLDAKLREQMRMDLKRLQRRLNITILFVTHDQSEALALSDRIAVMKDGRIEQFGSPLELYSSPKTVAVRDFLGRSILLDGRIGQRSQNIVSVALDAGAVLHVNQPAGAAQQVSTDACVVSVRPESISVVPSEGATSGGQNSVAGRIQTLLFMGNCYEAEVELPNRQTITMDLSPSRAWQEGQHIQLEIPADKLQLWPGRSEAVDAA